MEKRRRAALQADWAHISGFACTSEAELDRAHGHIQAGRNGSEASGRRRTQTASERRLGREREGTREKTSKIWGDENLRKPFEGGGAKIRIIFVVLRQFVFFD